MNLFPERLKSLINEKGLKYRDVEKATGIKYYTINAYANGKVQPDMDSLVALCIFFNVSSDYLVGISDKPYPDKVYKFIDEIESNINHQV